MNAIRLATHANDIHSPSKAQATAIIKAINRHLKRNHAFSGGRQYGIDYTTWRSTFPQLSAVYQSAAESLMGYSGRFLPRF